MPVNADIVFGGILLVGHSFMIAAKGIGEVASKGFGRF
jgi:hypothetical protein